MIGIISLVIGMISLVLTIKWGLHYSKIICNLISAITILKQQRKINIDDANWLLDIIRG